MSSEKSKIDALYYFFFFFSSRRRHTRYWRDWSSDVCSSDLAPAQRQPGGLVPLGRGGPRESAGGRQADPPERGLFGLPLVPRHGARVLRGRGYRADNERALR